MASGKDTIRGAKMIFCFLRSVLPLVNKELNGWQLFAAANIPDKELKRQALASIRAKRFHCQGGSFYSLYPGVDTKEFIAFVVALQTISDYLDNLCDRASVFDEKAFAQLHLAMTDAVDPAAAPKDYYAYYPFKEDGGYLARLVGVCQEILRRLPAYPLVKKAVLQAALLYSRLQTYKHILPAKREKAMLAWLSQANNFPGLSPWEFAAATGSTLGIFMLAAVAYQPDLTEKKVRDTTEAYFPFICGLHIQLDYFIDQNEDRENGDLNFIFYYRDQEEVKHRLSLFFKESLHQADRLPHAYFTKTIVQGLAALYLSDDKINTPEQKQIRGALLDVSGRFAKLLYLLCCILRKKHVL